LQGLAAQKGKQIVWMRWRDRPFTRRESQSIPKIKNKAQAFFWVIYYIQNILHIKFFLSLLVQHVIVPEMAWQPKAQHVGPVVTTLRHLSLTGALLGLACHFMPSLLSQQPKLHHQFFFLKHHLKSIRNTEN
jgi:hypothetical protein